VFANVVLADEINRAPPKTQSALLEALEEGQVTVDGDTYDLPSPFFVIATQNPVDMEGTFELPEAQVDRFLAKTSLGYPDGEGEVELLRRRAGRVEQAPSVDPLLDEQSVSALQQVPETIRVDDDLLEYMAALLRATPAGLAPLGYGYTTRADPPVAVRFDPRDESFRSGGRSARVLSGSSRRYTPWTGFVIDRLSAPERGGYRGETPRGADGRARNRAADGLETEFGVTSRYRGDNHGVTKYQSRKK
jgi:hypothetical protein